MAFPSSSRLAKHSGLPAYSQSEKTSQHSSSQAHFGQHGNWIISGADLIWGHEGRRYLIEQTVGFTIPRMIQQLYRNEHITGTLNTVAAWEMFARDISADIMDTLAPGILARFGIGVLLDKTKGTLTRRMMGSDTLNIYAETAKNTKNYSQFVQNIEQQLIQHAKNSHNRVVDKNLNLESRIQTLIDHKKTQGKKGFNKLAGSIANELAKALNLSNSDITLSKAINNETKTAQIAIKELVKDLHALQENYTEKHQKKGTWQNVMPDVLKKTQKLSQWHMVANGVALAASLAVPILIRMATKMVTGMDAFPGTTAIREHFNKEGEQEVSKAANSETAPKTSETEEAKDEKLEWFPYLKESWEKGKFKPLAITAGFFSVLLGTVYANRFTHRVAGKLKFKKLNWKNIVKAYEFDREFPWTSIAQMELTYGLLCGFRLATARDRNEFNEAGLRDALLGWPTLTYAFPALRKGLFWLGNKALTRNFKNPADLLMKGARNKGKYADQSARGLSEINQSFISRALGKNRQIDNMADYVTNVKTTAAGLTGIAALTSIGLLAYLEPKWGINWTNKLELAHRREQLKDMASSIYNNTTYRLQLGAHKTQEYANSLFQSKPAYDPTQSAYFQQAQRAISLDNRPYFIPNSEVKVAGRVTGRPVRQY